jgi:hypothetical protein
VLLIIEVKTRLDDLGGLQRQLGWYERRALTTARTLGWAPQRISTWLVCLASAEVDGVLDRQRDLFAHGFPARARDMLGLASGGPWHRRGIALLDPSSHRKDWLIRTRLDGRRSPAPYRDYADAARRFSS